MTTTRHQGLNCGEQIKKKKFKENKSRTYVEKEFVVYLGVQVVVSRFVKEQHFFAVLLIGAFPSGVAPTRCGYVRDNGHTAKKTQLKILRSEDLRQILKRTI